MNNNINPVLHAENLTKRFGKVLANDGITLDAYSGEILAIIGENGAGKSTFCKMITGLYHPTEGEIFINGEKVVMNAVADSLRAGIAMVYQERNVIDGFTGAQNICFGLEPTTGVMINEKESMRRAKEIRDRLGLTVPLDKPVRTMSAGEKQQIEIMRALYYNPSILILDEPTASLGLNEVNPFIDFIKKLCKQENIAVIFISHKLEEVFSLSDRIAVFTDGKLSRVDRTENLTQEDCIAAMLRESSITPVVVPDKDFSSKETVLEVTEDLFYDGKMHHVPIVARSGEVVGMYGLVGSGRTESLEVIYGLRQSSNLSFFFKGERITNITPAQMIERGMVLTPELRANAVFRDFDLTENIGYLFYSHFLSKKPFGTIDKEKTKQLVDKVLSRNNVKYSSTEQKITELSGGNMQKVIIGRSIEVEDMSLLALDEPTQGMDIGAKYEIYHSIRSLADELDKSIIFISSELDELLSVCDRIYVYFEGSIIKEFSRSEFNKSDILDATVRGTAVCA